MKQRQAGQVNGANYEIRSPDGGLIWQRPISEARDDTKLAAAIKRNGWEGLPDGS